ncbi:MAG: zinc ribbon domain-containing protein, partial [Firmicutes bacterium]|nr:zinc ribbon domain-containing protein [Bacillota bacterium]
MFCEKCGAQLPEGATFCEKCGNKTETDNNTAPAPNKDRVNNTKKQLGFIAAAVIAIAAAVLFILGHKTTVDLNNYLKAEFDGYNTVGKATISFDSDAFNEKYKNKFRRVTNSKIEDPAFIVVSYMKNSEKHEEDLSNGDVIEYQWDIEADKIEKEMGCKIKYSDTSFTVEGLKEVEVLDPFK